MTNRPSAPTFVTGPAARAHAAQLAAANAAQFAAAAPAPPAPPLGPTGPYGGPGPQRGPMPNAPQGGPAPQRGPMPNAPQGGAQPPYGPPGGPYAPQPPYGPPAPYAPPGPYPPAPPYGPPAPPPMPPMPPGGQGPQGPYAPQGPRPQGPPPQGPMHPGGGQVPPAGGTLFRSGDGKPAPRRFAIAAFALALFGALIVADQPMGIGLAILGIGLIGSMLTLEAPIDRFSRGCLVGAAILASVPAWRDSGWVTSLSLLGGLTLASVALTRARSWRELAVGMVAWWGMVIPAPFLVFADATRRATGRRWAAAGPVLRGTALASLLVLVFGSLFASADEDFAQLVRDLFDWNLSIESILGRALIFGVVLTIAGALWQVSVNRRERPTQEPTARLGRTEWLIALIALVILFGAFVALQLPELFNGNAQILTTDGLTYAGNARLGFVQMTFAAILTLTVIGAAAYWGPKGDRLVACCSAALCLLTIVVLASALHRLGLYQDAYGATRTRFSMHALMLWLGTMFAVITLAGLAGRSSILPRAFVVISTLFAIGTVAVNPDLSIADRNVARYAGTGTIDTSYLTSMSADAVPAIRALPTGAKTCVAARFTADLQPDEPVQSFNAGRQRARGVLAELDPAAIAASRASCAVFDQKVPTP